MATFREISLILSSPLQAFCRMTFKAKATSLSSTVKSSVDCRETTPIGGRKTGSADEGSLAINRSSSLAASRPICWAGIATLDRGGETKRHSNSSLSTPNSATSFGTCRRKNSQDSAKRRPRTSLQANTATGRGNFFSQ